MKLTKYSIINEDVVTRDHIADRQKRINALLTQVSKAVNKIDQRLQYDPARTYDIAKELTFVEDSLQELMNFLK